MFVYIMRAVGVSKIKIGITENLDRRLAEIQSMCPVPLEVVDRLAFSDFETEALIHRLLRSHWSHGEWFDEAGLERALRQFAVIRQAVTNVATVLAQCISRDGHAELLVLLYAAGASNIAHELTNLIGQSVMDKGRAAHA
jgi:hypothetical protein